MGARGTGRSRLYSFAATTVVAVVVIADYFFARAINHDGKDHDAGTLAKLAVLLIVSCLIAALVLRLLRPLRPRQAGPVRRR
ncbi:MAG: hypothetical protein ABSA40_01195 [Candidatus Dormibacteria bacterium]|jgi:hypothetical protein